MEKKLGLQSHLGIENPCITYPYTKTLMDWRAKTPGQIWGKNRKLKPSLTLQIKQNPRAEIEKFFGYKIIDPDRYLWWLITVSQVICKIYADVGNEWMV